MAKNISAIGIYPDRATVSDAVSVLQKGGYRATDISVLSSDNPGTKDFGHARRNKTWESAAMGAAAVAFAGAAAGWFLSLQSAAFPGLGALAAAGPVLAALAGAGAGGALGWIGGFLAGFGRSEYVARRYAGRIRRGGILLSVHCDSPEWCDRAMKTLRDTGARDVSSASETAADYGAADRPTERSPVTVTAPPEATPQHVAEPLAQETRK